MATASPPHTPAWLADPTGHHQDRFRNGTWWTSHLADNGRVSEDSLSTESPAARLLGDALGGVFGAVAGGLVGTAWAALAAAAVVTSAMALGWTPPYVGNGDGVLAGAIAGLLAWLLRALVAWRITTDRGHANPQSWDMAHIRMDELRARLKQVEQEGGSIASRVQEHQRQRWRHTLQARA